MPKLFVWSIAMKFVSCRLKCVCVEGCRQTNQISMCHRLTVSFFLFFLSFFHSCAAHCDRHQMKTHTKLVRPNNFDHYRHLFFKIHWHFQVYLKTDSMQSYVFFCFSGAGITFTSHCKGKARKREREEGGEEIYEIFH